MPEELSRPDVLFLIERCAALRGEALRRLEWSAQAADAQAEALVSWIEAAQQNTATLRLIRRAARAAGEARLVRLASAPLRDELAQAGALLVRLLRAAVGSGRPRLR